MSFFSRFFKTDDIPYGVRVLTYATSIRWIGWGFAESLLPIFLFSFGHTYAATGLLRSAYDIAFILALPIVGIAADRFFASGLILLGLTIYLFVGSSYLLAGITGLALFVVIARFLNGVSFSLDALGRETFIRRYTPKEKMATVFGYVDTVTNFWWIIAALIGMILVNYFSISSLLFMIVPTSLIAFLVVWRFRKSKEDKTPLVNTTRLRNAYVEMFRELGDWEWKLRLVALFNFFIAFSSAAVTFFLPIEAYVEGASLSKTILIGVVLTLPTLFGWTLGKFFDRRGSIVFLYGFIIFGLLFATLAFFDDYIVKLCVAFGIGIVLELLSVGSNELITVYANPEHFGRIGGVIRTLSDIGSMIGPLFIGVLIDWQGTQLPFILLAVLMLLLAIIFHIMRGRGTTQTPPHTLKYHHKIHQRV